MNRYAVNRSRNIFLIGMPCSGKTMFGKNYAFRTGRQFIDFDLYLERYAGKSIKEIVATEGEAGFRQRELRCLRRLEKRRGTVIAMGGGTICNPDNFRFVRTIGLIIWLKAPVEVLAARIFEDRDRRPLFAALQSPEQVSMAVAELLEKRSRFYDCADMALETIHSSVDNLALQMFATERGANSLVQRRETPVFLLGGKPLVSDAPALHQGSDGDSREEDGGEEEAPSTSDQNHEESSDRDDVKVDLPLHRHPEETWDDVAWRETIDSPIDRAAHRERAAQRPAAQLSLQGSPQGDGGNRKRRKRRNRDGSEAQRNERPGGQRNERPGGQRNERPGGQRDERPGGQRNERPGGQRNERPGGQRDQRPNNRNESRPRGDDYSTSRNRK